MLPLERIEIVEYVSASGSVPLAKWKAKLDASARIRINTCVLRLAEGNFAAVKGVVGGIFELRMDFGPGYRVYFGKENERVVILLAGGTKHRQQNDIQLAQSLWNEYRIRKQNSANNATV